MCWPYLWLHCKQSTPCSWGSKRVKELQEKHEKYSNNENWKKKKSFQRRIRCWMILIYAVKAPLHYRAGPSTPPLRLIAWFWMTASPYFKIVVRSVCCQQYPLLWCSELCQSVEHLSRQGPGLSSAEPPCCRHLSACRKIRCLSPFFSCTFSQTGGLWWLTTWPDLKPQGHPGADAGMMREHLWNATSGASTDPNATITEALSRPISDYRHSCEGSH